MQLPGAYLAAVTMGMAEAGIWGVVAGSQAAGVLALLAWLVLRMPAPMREGAPGGIPA
jgi:hypothetical protein